MKREDGLWRQYSFVLESRERLLFTDTLTQTPIIRREQLSLAQWFPSLDEHPPLRSVWIDILVCSTWGNALLHVGERTKREFVRSSDRISSQEIFFPHQSMRYGRTPQEKWDVGKIRRSKEISPSSSQRPRLPYPTTVGLGCAKPHICSLVLTSSKQPRRCVGV